VRRSIRATRPSGTPASCTSTSATRRRCAGCAGSPGSRWRALLTVVVGLLIVPLRSAGRRASGPGRPWRASSRTSSARRSPPSRGGSRCCGFRRRSDPAGSHDTEIAGSIGEDLERLERISHRFELIGTEPELESLSVRQVCATWSATCGAASAPRTGASTSSVDVPPGLPAVKGNEVLLIWALENVVKNALDALAGRGGKITIYAPRSRGRGG
jgi:signal transduction histidine kinase